MADIDQAKNHVHVLFYIWLTDTNGSRFADALRRAAREYVDTGFVKVSVAPVGGSQPDRALLNFDRMLQNVTLWGQ